MNYEYEKRLEAEVHRALKALPELPAPQNLSRRVLAAIEVRAARPWYRRAWLTWPAPMKLISFALLLALFGSVWFAGWRLPQVESVAEAGHKLGEWRSGLGVIWTAISVLLGAIVAAAKHLSTAVISAVLVALTVGYGLTVGLGTVYWRLAFARR